MLDIKKLKCDCCRCHDDFDGCTAWDCDVDFEISMTKVKDTANAYGMSVDTITLMLMAEEERKEKTWKKAETEENVLSENFNPFYDSKFLITFADSPDLGKKLLVEMSPEDLKRLRAEVDAALKIQEGE